MTIASFRSAFSLSTSILLAVFSAQTALAASRMEEITPAEAHGAIQHFAASERARSFRAEALAYRDQAKAAHLRGEPSGQFRLLAQLADDASSSYSETADRWDVIAGGGTDRENLLPHYVISNNSRRELLGLVRDDSPKVRDLIDAAKRTDIPRRELQAERREIEPNPVRIEMLERARDSLDAAVGHLATVHHHRFSGYSERTIAYDTDKAEKSSKDGHNILKALQIPVATK